MKPFWENLLKVIIAIILLFVLTYIAENIYSKLQGEKIAFKSAIVATSALGVLFVVYFIDQAKKRNDVAKYELLLPGLFLGFVIGATVFKYLLSNFLDLTETDKANFLIDIITILLAFTALIGFAVYTTLKKEIRDDQNKDIEDGRHFTEAQMFKLAGVLSFETYITFFHAAHLRKLTRDLNHSVKDKENNEEKIKTCTLGIQFYINDAISRTEQALRVMALIDSDKKTDKDRNEIFICMCENNIGWYLSERGDKKDKIRAQSLAIKIEENIKKYPNEEAENWSDTIEFINKVFK